MTPAPAHHLHSIQALRGVAALAVAFLHFAGLQVEENIRSGIGWQGYGWMGVDMFFIISGFIMVWVTARITPGVKTGLRFLVMRIIRIYPLWFACVGLLGLFFIVTHGVPSAVLGVPSETAWPHFVRSVFLIPQETKPLLSVGWTLIHEMYFYIVFAGILALGLRHRLPLAIGVWGGLTWLALLVDWHKTGPWADILFNPLSYLFMAGMVLALLILRQEKPKFAKTALITGLLLFAALFFTDYNLRTYRVACLIIPFSLIAYGCVGIEKITRRSVPRPLVVLGDISYSLYLTHYLVVVGWRAFLRPFYENGVLHESLPPHLTLLIDTAALLIASLITAYIFYRVVEQPSLKALRKRLPNYRTPKT